MPLLYAVIMILFSHVVGACIATNMSSFSNNVTVKASRWFNLGWSVSLAEEGGLGELQGDIGCFGGLGGADLFSHGRV